MSSFNKCFFKFSIEIRGKNYLQKIFKDHFQEARHYWLLITNSFSKMSCWIIIVFVSGAKKVNIISSGRGYILPQFSTFIWILVLKFYSYLSCTTSSLATWCDLSVNAVIQLTALPTVAFLVLCLLLSLKSVWVGVESKPNKLTLNFQRVTK